MPTLHPHVHTVLTEGLREEQAGGTCKNKINYPTTARNGRIGAAGTMKNSAGQSKIPAVAGILHAA